jgi:hypothetical protein
MTLAKVLLALGILAQTTALADGASVQFRKEAGGLVITVFTAPAPLCAGPVGISLLLQNRNGLEPVLDANVSLVLRSMASGAEIQAQPTLEQGQNKLQYASALTLAESGKWQLAVKVWRNGQRADVTGTIDVAPTHAMVASYWGYVVFPPLMIMAVLIQEGLIWRKSKG